MISLATINVMGLSLNFVPLNVFEEIRFIVELVLAEQLFMWFFAKRRPLFWQKSILGWILLLGLSIAFSVINVDKHVDGLVLRGVFIIWYVGLVLLSLVLLKWTYAITISDTLFIGIAAYSLQHIEYIAINEVLARGLWPSLLDNLPLYIFICVVTTFILYAAMIKIFAKKLSACEGLLYEDRWQTILFFLTMLMVLFVTAFLGQYIFLNGSTNYKNVNYLGAVYDFFSSVLVLVVQYSIFRISTLSRETEIIKTMLNERQRQYAISKENIDIINRKTHDLKHQIQALKQASAQELDRYIDEVNASVTFYESVIKTENEVVNTILSEKSLYCEAHGIKLTCIIDGANLDFMRTLDIYALLGNALDNAIESASKQIDPEKRIVSLNISTQSDFLSIQTNNYYEGTIQLLDGVPSTSKKNNAYHGFGFRSMKHLVQKYHGSLTISTKQSIFMLQIIIPIPKTKAIKE